MGSYVSAQIREISMRGEVVIHFGEDMLVPSDISIIDSAVLYIQLIKGESSSTASILKWVVTSYSDNELILEVTFNDPL